MTFDAIRWQVLYDDEQCSTAQIGSTLAVKARDIIKCRNNTVGGINLYAKYVALIILHR